MKREYLKPKTEVLIPKGENIMDEIVPVVSEGDTETNTGYFESEDEDGVTPTSFSLWDEEK